MSDFQATFKDKKARAFLEKLLNNVDDVASLHKDYMVGVVAFVEKDYADHFEKERGPDGKWKRWSASYRAAIEGKTHFRTFAVGGKKWVAPLVGPDPSGPPRKPGKVLQATRRLRQSFKPMEYKIKREAGGGAIEWENNAKTKSGFPYAAAHNTGGKKLPKRQFMWLSNKALNNISKHTVIFYTGGL